MLPHTANPAFSALGCVFGSIFWMYVDVVELTIKYSVLYIVKKENKSTKGKSSKHTDAWRKCSRKCDLIFLSFRKCKLKSNRTTQVNICLVNWWYQNVLLTSTIFVSHAFGFLVNPISFLHISKLCILITTSRLLSFWTPNFNQKRKDRKIEREREKKKSTANFVYAFDIFQKCWIQAINSSVFLQKNAE